MPTYSQQEQERFQKRAELIESGRNPYPLGGSVSDLPLVTVDEALGMLADMQDDPASDISPLVTLQGRLISKRNAGKLVFADIMQAGRKMQVQLTLQNVPDIADFKRLVDRGDHVRVSGELIYSNTGEPTLLVTERWEVTAKAVRALPNQHTPLNEETRVRRPYLGMINDPEQLLLAQSRSRAISALRGFLDGDRFFELETPMLQPIHGGASARPFTTVSNAYNTNLYLRIAVELYLKRAIIGGFDRVYEIGRNFRNEGADRTHSPEFTMLEAYEVGKDYNEMADYTQTLVQVFMHSMQSYMFRNNKEAGYAIFQDFGRIDLYGSLSEKVGQDITPETDRSVLLALLSAHDVTIPHVESALPGKLVEELWEALVKPTLGDAPVFVFDFPADTSPLAAPHRTRPGVAEKWDLYMGGMEVGTGYSELTDPVKQREYFEAQSLAAAGGDPEAMQLDEEFLLALEYGMPPTGGIGLGIDRLMMVGAGTGIREVQMFPFVAPMQA